MRTPTPFAAWLTTFLAVDRARLLHLGRSPRRQRSLIAGRRWRKAYPFVAARDPKSHAESIRRLRAESAYLRYTPWLLDPDVRLTLAAAALEFLATQFPLAPGDLNLPVVSAWLFGVHAPTEIGPVAPRVALILYALSSPGAPLRFLRDPSNRLIDQLAGAVRRRIESAPPADLVAVHVLMQRLLTVSGGAWAEAALRLCLPFSPLTRLLEDSNLSNQLATLAPYDWRGVEVVLCAFGLEGLQARCSQALIDSMLPGWDWHAVAEPVRYARFRRASELFNRLAWALNHADRPTFGPIRAMRLAAWILRTYRLLGRALDVYQRIVLPPPLDPDEPGLTPSFRLLHQYFPTTPEGVREHVAGLAAPIRPVMALLVEASRATSTPVYVPDGLPVSAWSAPFASAVPDDALNVVARQLIETWKTMDMQYGPLLGNLHQFAQASLGEPSTAWPGEFDSEGDLAVPGLRQG
jgi:hypothetical protein